MDNLYGRRTNNTKLSLSTNTGDASSFPPSARSATLPKRFGGDSSSHSKPANPFNSVTTPGGRIMSPTSASSAFGLGSGAFSSFGSSAKAPKSAGLNSSGNPFDLGAKVPPSAGDKSAAPAGGRLPAPIGLGSSAATSFAGRSAALAAAGGNGSQASHPLANKWAFWFRPPISKANGFIEYEKTLHAIAEVATVEDFFAILSHLKHPSTLPLVSDYHFFRTRIRPIWEDAENRKGGKWVVKLKKGVADRLWESLLLALIGDQFGDTGDEVCGAVLSVRNGEDILSIWTRSEERSILKVRETMKRVLEFPPNTRVEWKSHGSSIQQRSAIEESRRERPNTHYNNASNQQSNNNNNSHNHNNHNHNNTSNGAPSGHNNPSNSNGGTSYHHGQHPQQYHQPERRTFKQSGSLTGGEDRQQGHVRSTP